LLLLLLFVVVVVVVVVVELIVSNITEGCNFSSLLYYRPSSIVHC